MTKGYQKPDVLKQGKCFICGLSCSPDSYCHFDCAHCFSIEQNRKIAEAKALTKSEENKNEKSKEE